MTTEFADAINEQRPPPPRWRRWASGALGSGGHHQPRHGSPVGSADTQRAGVRVMSIKDIAKSTALHWRCRDPLARRVWVVTH